MKPLNTKERDSSFWIFVLFFTLSVTLITAVVSFNFIIPKKQYAELKVQLKEYDAFKAKQSGFMSQIDAINLKLKEYNTPGAAQTFLLKDISNKNIELETSLQKDKVTNGVYNKIIENNNIMLSLKAELNGANKQLSEANGVLRECEEDNRKIEKELKEKREKK